MASRIDRAGSPAPADDGVTTPSDERDWQSLRDILETNCLKRRAGKTMGVALFAGAFQHAPGAEISTFSTGLRTSQKILALVCQLAMKWTSSELEVSSGRRYWRLKDVYRNAEQVLAEMSLFTAHHQKKIAC